MRIILALLMIGLVGCDKPKRDSVKEYAKEVNELHKTMASIENNERLLEESMNKEFLNYSYFQVTSDGCIIQVLHYQDEIARVGNPKQCRDKNLVRYLNCFDMYIRPKSERPEECR